MHKTLIKLILILLVGTSCKPKTESTGGGYNSNRPMAITGTSFSLITPAVSPNFSATIQFSINGVAAKDTVKVYSDSACQALLSSKVATGSSVNFTISSLGIGTHKYYTLSTNSVGSSTCSLNYLTYNYLGVAPTIASSIALFSPVVTPDFDSTPTFLLSGLVNGETIKLFKNSSCTQLVGSAIASGSTVQITSTALAPGVYSFFTNSTNAAAQSACSSISASYEYSGILPTTASSMVLSSPTVSPNYSATPVFTLSGNIVPGDTVKVYNDSLCTTLVGSTLSVGTSVTVTISTISTIGSSAYYTKSSNIIGSSNCSGALAGYNFLGPAPTVSVSWNPNREAAVNRAGGGYRVYYGTTSGFNTATAAYKDVPYVSGATSPTTTSFNNLLIGTHYFKIMAYSQLNPVGGVSGSLSAASSQFSVSLP